MPQKQPKRGRFWLAEGSCLRLRPEYPNHVWSYDFVAERTHAGRALRTLNIIDEYTHECLAICVGRRLTGEDVWAGLTDLFCTRGGPQHLRADNGSKFACAQVRPWLNELGPKPLFIEPGSPWENGYIESFHGKFRDERLNREIFYSLPEAQVLIEQGRRAYHTVRPHSALGSRPPDPEAILAPVLAQPLGVVETVITT